MTVTVDNTPPVVTLDAPSPGSIVIEPTHVKATARDASSAVTSVRLEYSGGEEWIELATVSSQPYSALLDTAVLAEGDYRLRAVALDAAGNESTSKASSIRVERVDPAIQLGGLPAVLTGVVELRPQVREGAVPEWVEFQATPTESFDWRTLARVESAPFGIALDTSSLPDGGYDVRALAGQKDGRVDASRPLRGVRIDNTPPWIVLNEPRDGAWVREEVVLSAQATDEGSGLKSMLFQFSPDGRTWRPVIMDGVPSGPGSALWNTGGLADGRYLLRAVAGDVAGNLAASEPVRVQLDRTPPESELRQPAPGAILTGIVTLVADARDEGSGVIGLRFECSQDGEHWAELASMAVPPFNAAWDTRKLADGQYRLRCVARDGVGNSAFGVPVEVTVANNAPAPAPPAPEPVPYSPPAAPPPPAIPEPYLDLTPRALEAATLWQLERLAAQSPDDPRHEEREALLYSLRSVAKPDGTIPDRFWGLIWETFGELFKP
jgi:hypothetical protein